MAERRDSPIPTPVEMIRTLKDSFSAELGGLNPAEESAILVLRYAAERLEEMLRLAKDVLWVYDRGHEEQ